MAGLLSAHLKDDEAAGAAPARKGAMPERPMKGEDLLGGKAGAASSDGQDAHDQFVKNGMRLIYNEKTLPAVLQSLEGEGNPPLGLANTTLAVIKRLEQSAAKAGKEIPPDAHAQGTVEIMQLLAELSEKTGGHEYTRDELEAALQFVVRMHDQIGPMGPEPDAGDFGAPAASALDAAEPAQRRGLLA